VADLFATHAEAFLVGLQRLLAQDRSLIAADPSLPEMCDHADFLAAQRDNPLIDFTLPRLYALDLADSFLSWVAARADDDDALLTVLQCSIRVLETLQ
jgi:hypothetical protein